MYLLNKYKFPRKARKNTVFHQQFSQEKKDATINQHGDKKSRSFQNSIKFQLQIHNTEMLSHINQILEHQLRATDPPGPGASTSTSQGALPANTKTALMDSLAHSMTDFVYDPDNGIVFKS